jgi:sugar-phosphatase
VLVIEDAPAGIEAAHAAGSTVAAVASTHPVEELAAADEVFPSLAATRTRIVEWLDST